MALKGVERNSFFERVEMLRNICNSEGWDSYGAAPVLKESWDNATALASNLADKNIPWPYLYPAIQGGTLLEWDAGEWIITIEIEKPSLVFIDMTKCNSFEKDSENLETNLENVCDRFLDLLKKHNII